ncbi:MAG: hypothetical protein H7834_04050 [Magnetococcus sp. YQC-9]
MPHADALFIILPNRTHFGMRRFSQDCVQDAGVVSKRQKTTPAKAARGAFFAKNASFEARAKGLKSKAKPWERNLPDPLFFYQ